MHVVALRAAGTTVLWLGQFAAAERDLRLCLEALGDGAGYLPFASDLGASPFSLVASDRAAALTVLGRHQEARQQWRALASTWRAGMTRSMIATRSRSRAGSSSSRESSSGPRPMQGAWSGSPRSISLRRCGAWGRRSTGLFARSLQTIPGMASAMFIEAWASGRPADLRCSSRAFSQRPPRSGCARETARQAGRALKEAFESAQKSGEGFYIAEMHRLRGEILWQYDKDLSGAESDLGKAWEISGAQQSGTFRLRTAMSLLNLTRSATTYLGVARPRQSPTQSRFCTTCSTRSPMSPSLRTSWPRGP